MQIGLASTTEAAGASAEVVETEWDKAVEERDFSIFSEGRIWDGGDGGVIDAADNAFEVAFVCGEGV